MGIHTTYQKLKIHKFETDKIEIESSNKERGNEKHTASGLPMSLATEEVASERMEEVSTPSRFTLVERLRQGIFAFSDVSLDS